MSSDKSLSKSNSFRKPPLPISTSSNTSSIGRSYSTLNKLILSDLLNPTASAPSRFASNHLEVPDASTTYLNASTSSYRTPSTTSMLFGSMSSSRSGKSSSSQSTKVKSSSPILFRRLEKYRERHNENSDYNSSLSKLTKSKHDKPLSTSSLFSSISGGRNSYANRGTCPNSNLTG